MKPRKLWAADLPVKHNLQPLLDRKKRHADFYPVPVISITGEAVEALSAHCGLAFSHAHLVHPDHQRALAKLRNLTKP